MSKYNACTVKKIETLWHHILYEALTKKCFRFTQRELARRFSYSLSTVYHALEAPTRIGGVRKESKFFVLTHPMKLLLYWASQRNLAGSIIYQTYSPLSVREREGQIAPTAIYACYSAARKILGEPPADYESVYLYDTADHIDEIIRRFPQDKSRKPNIFVLAAPPSMRQYGVVTTIPQTYVDIWNLHDWYAHDFTNALEEKIHGLLS